MKFLGLLYYIFLYHMMMIAPLAVGDQSHSPGMRVNDIAVRKEEEICGDIDIRNNVSQFSRLENCSVIEGFLQIILIDKGHPRDYENLTFPKLREITEYFLLYRVTGLITLRHIFPNLAVIRGAKLFYNYAFVVYEMISLQEIGLDSLTDILRGSVRIEKNHLLCYVNTINWDLICKNGKGGHFIKSNKGDNECPNDCPLNKCQEGEYVKHCWNRVRCHKSCKDCGTESSCIKGSQCCHKECLGGCSVNDSPQNCSVCRNVVYDGRCMDKCNLPNTFQYAGRRCITERECRALTNLTLDGSGNPTVYWKPFHDMCISECPSGYMEDDNDRYSCKRCNGSCPKVCQGMIVNSVSAAQELYGCTKISGALEIQIQGGDQTVQELEINLGKIEEVEDYVKIFRAYPLVSLNFLRNLRKINGKNQEKDSYSLYVLDNPNLQELWDFTNKTLEITNGKIFFHFNPRLCISKIKELKIKAGLPDWDDNDVSPHSNGDKEGCDSHTLYVNVTALSTSATVKFTNFLHVINYDMDYRRLLGYVISYREAPEKNVTLYDGRDGCGSDSWMVVHHLSDGNEKISSVVAFIGPLKPFTQYALYIQTYTIATEKKGGHSPIIYFTTHPDIPSTPLDLKGQSLSPNELTLSWLSPNKPNGNITHYIVRVYYQADDKEFLERRNYCSEPILPPAWKKDEVPSEENNIENGKTTNNWVNSTSSEDCCACPKEKTEKEETEFEIQFEDFLHNKVYIKRQRREIKNEIEKTLASNSSTTEKSDRYTDNNLKTEIIVNSTFRDPKYLSAQTTTAVIQDLKHFSDYTIEVIACHDPEMEGNIEKEKRCSSKAITSAKTLPLSGADNIPSTSLNVRVVNETVGDVKVRWEEPLHPNGLIVSYQIEYRRIDIENNNAAPTSTICVTQQNFTRQRYHMLQLMGAGNYSVRVRAVSLAGYGDWTSFFYFNIEQLQDGMRPEVLAAVIASVTILLVFLIIGISLVVFKKRFPNRIPNGIIYASINPDYLNALISECEIAPEKISIIREIGQGSFGMVYEGELKDYVEDEPCIRCAVKTINFTSDIRDPGEILQEAVIMRNFRSHHIVKFLGVVTVTQPVMVVMELMVNGDLKNYLRSHRPDTVENQGQQPPTLKRILQMAIEIADGMAYLSTKKFVHRDLAARNCMVAEDLTVKIGDFGMTRDIYETDYYRKGGRGLLPVRWMAPESLKDGIFTSSSDVWSYGVVLWEMATLASQPYQGLSNEQVLKYIIDGGIMERPENCPEKLYNLMMVCWQSLPKDRPSFLQIIEILLPDAIEKFQNVSFYHTQLIKPDDEEEQEQQTEEGKAIAASPLQYVDNNMCLLLSEFDKDTEVSLHFSPNRRFLDGEGGGGETERTFSGDCGESSRCLSLNSNEHNKINNHSMNGGLLNGHLHFPVSRDTEC